ncbi:MAG: rod shape-determining protein RodA [Burkholderiales bacterium]|jgi:rod shape determining protein RodA|nr:rod shape-determining protein RodA [Burkholderiales bacterium]
MMMTAVMMIAEVVMIVPMLSKIKTFFRALYDLDQTVILTLFCLAVINILVQYSANDKMLSRLFSDVVYLGTSFVILLVVANLNISALKHIAIPIYLISLVLLVAVLMFGVKVHGAQRWLNLGIRIQPSELCKLSVPLILAYYFSLQSRGINFIDYIVGFIFIVIPFALIAKQPDLGTGILVLCSGIFVIFFAGLSWRIIILALIIFLISTPVIWHMLHDYQQHRILTLLNPESDPLGKGYHIIQGIIAIGSGGLYGKGFLHGTQIHLDFIPEKNTDFVITVLAEEFGFVGVCVVLALYLVLVSRGLRITQLAHDIFSKTLAGSITMSLMLYILINMGMVAGILPVVGVPLPLISYGGTATIVLMIGFGILLSIHRQSKY